MSSKKQDKAPNRYCKIIQWIENHNNKLADCIKDLCLENSLYTSQKNPGVTFLMPTNEVVNKIYDDTYGSGNADDAVKIVLSHIIPEYIPDVKSLLKFKKLGNKLWVLFSLKEKNATNSVHFEGFTIEPVSSFETLSNKNIAVWKVTNGQPPLEGEKYEKPKASIKSPKRRPSVSGGIEFTDDIKELSLSYKALYTNFIENHYIVNYITKPEANKKNAFLYSINKLLDKMSTDFVEEYNMIKILLDDDYVVSYYLLFEPYKTKNESLLANIVTEDFVNEIFISIKNNSIGNYKEDYTKYVAHVFNNQDVNKLVNIRSYANKYKNELLEIDNFFELRNNVLQIYAELEVHNKLSELTNIFNTCLYNHYKSDSNKFKRLWQDELRYIIKEKLKQIDIEYDYAGKIEVFNNLCNILKIYFPGNNYATELQIINECDYKLSYCIRDRYQIIKSFIISLNFLYVINIPYTNGEEHNATMIITKHTN